MAALWLGSALGLAHKQHCPPFITALEREGRGGQREEQEGAETRQCGKGDSDGERRHRTRKFWGEGAESREKERGNSEERNQGWKKWNKGKKSEKIHKVSAECTPSTYGLGS